MPNVFVTVDDAVVVARAVDLAVVAEEVALRATEDVAERAIVFVALRGEDAAATLVVVCVVGVALLFTAAALAVSVC